MGSLTLTFQRQHCYLNSNCCFVINLYQPPLWDVQPSDNLGVGASNDLGGRILTKQYLLEGPSPSKGDFARTPQDIHSLSTPPSPPLYKPAWKFLSFIPSGSVPKTVLYSVSSASLNIVYRVDFCNCNCFIHLLGWFSYLCFTQANVKICMP